MPKKIKIISLNANGIRAAARKGFFQWLAAQNADVVCIQETKAQFDQLRDDPQYQPEGYYCYYVDAIKKGYSGVAVYSREKPLKVIPKLGVEEFDNEGRYLELQFERFAVVSLYAPSGSSSDERQAAKFRFMDIFMPHLKNLKRRKKPYIICGDWNIAHKEIDLKNWRGNRKNSGFYLKNELGWMSYLISKVISTFSEKLMIKPINILGGLIVANRGLIMSAGVLTTILLQQNSVALRVMQRSTKINAFQIMHHLSLAIG